MAKKLLIWLIVFLAIPHSGFAVKPVNDSCHKALSVTLGKGNFELGSFLSDSINIDSADIQISEFFHSSLISAGNDKKTIWFKFYLPARRGVNIELKQNANFIGVRDCGFTTFFSNSCLPGSSAATAAKITTLNQFGSSFHPCMEPGWYLVQVSAKARAMGKIYLEITTSYPYQNLGVSDAKYDAKDSAFLFSNNIIGYPGYKSTYKDFELGCYTIQDSSEYFYALGSNHFNRFTQSAWFVFKAFDNSDAARISIEGVNYYLSGSDTMAYRIYKGDCRNNGNLTLMDSGFTDFSSGNRCYSYYGAMSIYKDCYFDSGATYTIQLLFHKDEQRVVRLTLTDATSAYDITNNYKPLTASSYNFGTFLGYASYNDGFSCRSKMSYNNCGSANPSTGVNLYGYRYNMANWYRLTIPEQSGLTVTVAYPGNGNSQLYTEYGFRIFKDTATGNCNDVSSSRLVFTGKGYYGNTFMCLDKGEYLIQVLGIDSVYKVNSGCYGNAHLGRDYVLQLNRFKLPTVSRFSLYGKKWADTVNVKADTLSPLTNNQYLVMGKDTVTCMNTIMPESYCDTNFKKAMYRVFKVGDGNKDGVQDSGAIYITNLRTKYTGVYVTDHRLYKGNALKLRDNKMYSSYPDTLKNLRPYTNCFGKTTTSASYCVEPGEYTLVSYFDQNSISDEEQPAMYYYSPKTKFSTYARAENLGRFGNTGTYYGQLDTFTCRENPDTIDGVFCGKRNTYHVFYMDSVAVATIGIDYYSHVYGGATWSLFTGDIRNGKSSLRKYNNSGDWTCSNQSYSRSTTDCKPLQPGWYTIMVSNNYNLGFDSSRRGDHTYRLYYQNIFPHRINLSFRKINVILPKYNSPAKAANVDSLVNANKPLSYAANYSSVKSLPQRMAKFVLPTEYFQCDFDTPFVDFPKSKICYNIATNVVYYTFKVSKPSWTFIQSNVSGANNYKVQLYRANIRKNPKVIDSISPIQNCNYYPHLLEYCSLQPGEYTLVYFINRYYQYSTTITPTIFMDSVMKSRFDFAKNAYDFGAIPGDSTWHNGKIGDVNPIDSLLPASQDVLSCRTGAWPSDPTNSTCYVYYNPYVYRYIDSAGSLNPYDSSYYKIGNQNYSTAYYGPRRNIWYTFTHKGPGKLNLKLNTLSQNFNSVTTHLRYSVYVSNVDGNIPYDSLRKNGGIDSTLVDGLTFLTKDDYYGYCYYPSALTATVDIPICDNYPRRRYYVLVEVNNYTGDMPFNFNHHVSLSVKYDTTKAKVIPTFSNHYSNASRFPQKTVSNLLYNPTGLYGSTGWINNAYVLNTTASAPTINAYSFMLYGYYTSNPYIQQDIDLKNYEQAVKSGNAKLKLGGNYMSNVTLSGTNGVDFRVLFYDSTGNLISTSSTGAANATANQWYVLGTTFNVPSNTRRISYRVYVPNPNSYPIVYLNDLLLEIQQNNVNVQKNNTMVAGQIYVGERNYMGDANVDAADYKYYGYTCGKSVWYKIKVDTSGYLFANALLTYNSGYFPGFSSYGVNGLRLFRETIPGDSINGLSLVTMSQTSSSKFGYTSYACVQPGWYYLYFNPTCHGYTQTCLDYLQPVMYLDYHRGDYCSNALDIEIDTLEKVTTTGLVHCKTIGTDYGEDGSDMGCLFGPKGYKSTWFKVDFKGNDKVDLEFKLVENTSVKPAEIRYRTYYGNCQNLTAAPCNTNSQTTFTIDCIKKGTYYVQVITPESATGTIDLSVEAKKNTDSTCVPVDIFQPNAAFYYNVACPENSIEFINTSSRGDSITYLWDFGYNKMTSASLNPSFTYPSADIAKTYKVKLLVFANARKTKDSMELYVTVPYSPKLEVKNSDTMLCEGQSVWLKAVYSHSSGYWNTGSFADSIKVNRTGIYTYRMRDRPNLLRNANAEQNLTSNGWTAQTGTWYQGSSVAYDSTYFFYSAITSGEAELFQIVNIAKDSVEIDSGIAKIGFTGWYKTRIEDISDQIAYAVEYYDKNNNLLATFNSGYINNLFVWEKFTHNRSVPRYTRKVKVRLFVLNRGSNTSTDAYFDNLTLKLRSACDYKDSVYVQVNPIPKLSLGQDTSFCHNDSLTLRPTISYTNPFIVYEPMDGTTSFTGKLISSASYIPSLKYSLLTKEISSEFGAIDYTLSNLKISDSFDISAEFDIINNDGYEGTWSAMYLFNSQEPSNYNFYTSGGYSIFYDEYLNTNRIQLYWGGAQLKVINLNTRLSNSGWRSLRVRYNNKRFEFYLDNKLIDTYFDNVTRTAPGNHAGVLSSNYSYQNIHKVRNFYITRSKTHSIITPPSQRTYTYVWNDNSTSSFKKINSSGSYFVRAKDKYGCLSNFDTIAVNRIKTYDSLLLPIYRVCALLDTFRIQAIVKKGFFYGNSAVDSSGLVKVKNAGLGSNFVFRQARDSFNCIYKDTTNFFVDSIPDIQITTIQNLCKNSAPVQLKVNYKDGYFYGGPYVDSLGTLDPSKCNIGVNKVYFRTNGLYCVGFDSISVVIDSIPSAKIAPAGPFCKNAGMKTIQHASNAGGTYSGGSYVNSSGSFNPLTAGVGTHKVYYTFTDSRSCTNTDSIIVRVDSIPSAKITPAGPFCKNAGLKTIQHASNSGGTYSGGSYINSSGSFNPLTAGVGTHKVYYTFTDSRSCTNTDSITVRVDSIPSAKIAAAGPFCKNAGLKTIQHASNSGGTYSGGSYINSSGSFNPLTAGVGTHKVYYTFTDSRSCTNTDSITVRVDSIPSAKIAAAGPFCKNAGLKTIQHASNAGGTYSGGSYINSSGSFNPLTAGVGTHKVYYTFTDSRSCTNTDSITIRVDSIPSAKIAPAGPFCKNAGMKMIQHASNAGGTYSGGSYINSGGSFNPLTAGVGTHKVYYTFTDSRSCTNTDSIAVRVDSIPSAKIAAAGPFCKNAGLKTIQHASNAGGTYSGGSYITSSGSFNPAIASIGNNKIYYTFTDSRSCTNTDSITVRVDSIPSAKIAAAGPFCKNAGLKTIQHASNAGGTYSGGSYVNSSGSFNPLTAGVGTHKVYYTFTDSRSCTNTDSITVRVDSIPSAKITPAGPFCKNAGLKSIQHASNAGGTYSGGSYINSSGSFNPLTAGVGTHKVYYTFTDSRSCTNTDSITVRVDSIPSAKIAAAGPFCKNAGLKTIQHASNAGGTYSGGSYITSSGSFNPANASIGNNKIYYTFTDSRSCTNTDSITVRVDSIPSAKIAPSGPFCKNAGLKTIQHASNSGGSYSGGSYINSSGSFNPLTAGVGTHKVYYTFTDSRSCTNTDSISVRVDSIPSAKIASSGPFCKNAGLKTIQHASNAGGTYSGGSYINSSGSFNPLTAGVGTHKVYYTFTDSRSCTNTDSIIVRVDSIPSAKIAPSGPFCKNAGLKTIQHASNAGGTYSGGSYITSSGSFNPANASIGNNKIYYTFTDSRSCTNTDSITVRVDSIPSAKIAAAGPFCKNAGLKTIQHASNSGGTYSGGSYINSGGSFNPLTAGVGTHKVYYTFTDSRSCTNTDSITVRVDSIPSAKIAPSGPFCKNAGLKTIQHASNAGGTYSGGSYINSSGSFNPLTAGVGTHKVYYTFTDSRSCTNTDSITVRVDSIPSAKIAAAGPFCKNAGMKTIQHASNAGGTYSGGSYITSSGSFNPANASIGNNKIYYTFTDSRSCTNTDSITIKVDSIPSAKIAASGPFCKNAGLKTIQHASNSGGTYSGGSYINSSGSFNPLTAGVGTHKVYYTFTDSRSCTNTDSITVRVDSIPSAKITPAGPFCKNAGLKSIQHASNSGGTYSGGSYINSSGSFNPLTAGVGTHKVYYTFTDSRSCTNTDSITVRVDSIPSAKIAAAGPFCKNAGLKTIQHASNAGGTYSGGSYINSSGSFDPLTAGVGTHRVYYTFTDSRSCTNTDSITVRVDSIPSAKIAAAGPFCKNAGLKTIQHASNAGGMYSGGSYVNSGGSFNPLTAGVGTHKVYYTFTDSRSCTNTDSITIRVDSIPSAKIAAAGPFCKNAGIQLLQHNSYPGGTYSGGVYVTGSGDFDPATANIGLSTVYYDYTNSLGCSNRDSVKIRVFDLPDASIKSAGPFCENISAQQLSALINTGGKFIEQTYVDSNGLFYPSIAKVGAHKVKYKYTDANLCSNIDSITISVLKKPDAQILPLGPFCQNASAAKINVAENGGTFKSEAYISLNGDFMPDKANIGSNRIIYSIVNSNNCAEADTVFVTVNKAPNNTITLQPENGCSPLKVIFSTEIEDKIEWEINSVKYSNPKDSVILLSGLYEVKLRVENSFFCVQNLKDTITVYQPPVADFDFSPDKLYMSDPSAQFIDRSKGNIVKWNWNFGDNDSSALTDPIHNYKQPGSYKIVLFVKDNNNCTDSSSGLLNVLDLFVYHIPSVFSPNDDGHNDVFAIEGLGIVWINCQIFNRWGEKLLDVKNFTSWDGMYQGEMVQDGVYLYLVQIKDNKGRIHYIKGEVTVLR